MEKRARRHQPSGRDGLTCRRTILILLHPVPFLTGTAGKSKNTDAFFSCFISLTGRFSMKKPNYPARPTIPYE
jgi:hypothetical protein